MKSCIRFRLPVLIAVLGLMLAGRVTAQKFTTLHSFTAISSQNGPYTNSDGANPYAGLVLSGSTLYGAAHKGGTWENGTLFKVNVDGTGFATLHNFTAMSPDASYTYEVDTNSDGASPYGSLVLCDDTLYGTTYGGGSLGNGTVFKVTTNGTGFTMLYSFGPTPPYPGPYTNGEGAFLKGGLVLESNTLYGTTYYGGIAGKGTVFKVNIDGTGFTNLHVFINPDIDGAYPVASLRVLSNTLYGTTTGYGSTNVGSVFAVNTDTTGFTNLHNFVGSDGSFPYGFLVFSGNTMYSTTASGGSSHYGTIFALNTDGTSFATLHNYTATETALSTNTDGAVPFGGLTLSGNTLYGTTQTGGTSGSGTIFAVNTNGTGFTTLYNFTLTSEDYRKGTNSDGSEPASGLVLSGYTLYGTAQTGGDSGNGTVFSLSFPPQLTIIPSGPYVILTWPTNYAGFDYTGFTLQATTDLGSPVWTTVSPGPVVIGGQNVVVNTISGTQQFFRLSQ